MISLRVNVFTKNILRHLKGVLWTATGPYCNIIEAREPHLVTDWTTEDVKSKPTADAEHTYSLRGMLLSLPELERKMTTYVEHLVQEAVAAQCVSCATLLERVLGDGNVHAKTVMNRSHVMCQRRAATETGYLGSNHQTLVPELSHMASRTTPLSLPEVVCFL
jgi:hypothetical protein